MKPISEIYRGWQIQWTGWKGIAGHKTIYKAAAFPESCTICERWLIPGEEIVDHWDSDLIQHFSCIEKPWYLIGQWTGIYTPIGKVEKFLYSSIPGSSGPATKGMIFDIDPMENQVRIELDTPESVVMAQTAAALAILKNLIDEEIAHPSGYWNKKLVQA